MMGGGVRAQAMTPILWFRAFPLVRPGHPVAFRGEAPALLVLRFIGAVGGSDRMNAVTTNSYHLHEENSR